MTYKHTCIHTNVNIRYIRYVKCKLQIPELKRVLIRNFAKRILKMSFLGCSSEWHPIIVLVVAQRREWLTVHSSLAVIGANNVSDCAWQ